MEFSLVTSVPVLEKTPEVLKEQLLNLPEAWVVQNEGENTWSPFDVVGHLIHGDKTDWIPRARIILFEEGKHFKPFDRFAQFEASKGKTLSELLNEFEYLRKENIKELKSWGLTEQQLDLTGIHPEFGEITLRQLLATWVAHDLGHLVQISRTMARQYKEAVGPWTKYLSVFDN